MEIQSKMDFQAEIMIMNERFWLWSDLDIQSYDDGKALVITTCENAVEIDAIWDVR